MARTIRRSNSLPAWEAEKLSRQARKAVKQNRKLANTKRTNHIEYEDQNNYQYDEIEDYA